MKGIAMFLEPTPDFKTYQMPGDSECQGDQRSFSFPFGYFKKYRKSFALIFLTLVIGSLIQLALPFFTQSIVDGSRVHLPRRGHQLARFSQRTHDCGEPQPLLQEKDGGRGSSSTEHGEKCRQHRGDERWKNRGGWRP